MIFFQETASRSRGTYIRVINGPFSLGWIAVPSSGGTYHYYEPENNEHTPILSGTDLEALKKQIAARRH